MTCADHGVNPIPGQIPVLVRTSHNLDGSDHSIPKPQPRENQSFTPPPTLPVTDTLMARPCPGAATYLSTDRNSSTPPSDPQHAAPASYSSTAHSQPRAAVCEPNEPPSNRRCATCLRSEADIETKTEFRRLKPYQLQFFSELFNDMECQRLKVNPLGEPGRLNTTTVFSNLAYDEKETFVCNRCHLALINW